MWLQITVFVLLVLAVLIRVMILHGKSRWETSVKDLQTRMQAVHSQTSTKAYDPRETADLPAPVQRYFGAVLKEGQPVVAAVDVTHTGTFNMGDSNERWVPFDSTQYVITRRPGFVWDARIRMAPGLVVFVHDAYVAGEGALAAKILGLFTVMEQPSTPEQAQGELTRFFAEAAWYPTALLPSQGVRWEAIDDTQASATITDGSTEVKLVVSFDEQGLISAVHSDGRYREVDGVQVATPWQGRFWDYEWRDGMQVPLEGEVAWLLPEGPKPYWRGRIQRIKHESVVKREMRPLEIYYRIMDRSARAAWRTMTPAEFHASITLHDSGMQQGVFGYPGDDFAVLVFWLDIYWNRDLLSWDPAGGWPYLFLGVQGVTSIRLEPVSDGKGGTPTIYGAETVNVEGGYTTVFEGIISGESVIVEHTGLLRVICCSTYGEIIEFRDP